MCKKYKKNKQRGRRKTERERQTERERENVSVSPWGHPILLIDSLIVLCFVSVTSRAYSGLKPVKH
jgi:hypothetical protein